MSEKTKELKYKFTNQIMFAIIMRDEELCSELIQRIIPERRIRKIRFPDSPVVNLKYLESVEPSFNGVMLLHMKNGEKEYISRKFVPQLKKYLGL